MLVIQVVEVGEVAMQELAGVELEVVSSGSFGEGDEPWSIRRGRFEEGLSAGIDVIHVSHGDFAFTVLPTRGMGILSASLRDQRIGWNSPVRMPVHPAFVNLQSRNGLGWLDGFNELMCRCGLSFNGPPGQDESVGSPIESDITLHGKVANLAAHSIEIIDGEDGEIGVSGIVDESTLFGPQLRLKSSITTRLGENSFTVRDEITNLGSTSTELQLLYHTNFGDPFLEEGAKFSVPASRVIPRDEHAAKDVNDFQTYLAPTAGYSEQAYFFETIADADGRSVALLESRDGSRGVSLSFRKDQLPCFTQWKCTQPLKDGYVTGLEPGTNYPNFKTFERKHGRVVVLEAGASYEVELILAVHSSHEEVAVVQERIEQLQGDRSPEVLSQPSASYCAID